MQQTPDALAGNSYSTTKYILKEETRLRRLRRCCNYKHLLSLVVILTLVCAVLVGVLVWRVAKGGNGGPSLSSDGKTCAQVTQQRGCTFKPRPLGFEKLPESIVDVLAKLQDFIVSGINQEQATAVSANVVYNGKVIWKRGYGVMNKSATKHTEPTENTIYPCASITKIVTALMLFKLYSDQKLTFMSLPVTRFEPKFSVHNPFSRESITLGDLATQRSGLPREAPCYPASAGNMCPYSYNAMLQRISNLTLLREPGVEAQYSNLGWSLLGQVLVKWYGRGQNYTSWIVDHILKPLGMKDSTFWPNERQRQNVPVGYTSADAYSQIQDWGWLAPAGGLFSSVHDLAKMEIQLMSGKIFPRWVTEEFFRPAFILHNGHTLIGIPWEGQLLKGLTMQEKVGYVYGYNSYVAMVPELKLAFNSMCTNCDNKLDSSLQKYFREIVSTFHDVLVNESRKSFTLPPDPATYVGQYRADSSLPIINQMTVHLTTDGPQRKLAIAVNSVEYFYITYTRPLHFRIRLNSNILQCKAIFTMGVDNDPVVFDPPSPVDGLSNGFMMFNAHPSGRSYFKRIR